MSTPNASQAADGGAASLLSREVLIVSLAIVALVVAAFAAPPIGASTDGPGPDTGPGSTGETNDTDTPTPTGTPETPSDGAPNQGPGEAGESGESGGSGGGEGGGDGVRVTAANGSGDGSGSLVDVTESDRAPHHECFVIVWDRLVPGRDATVLRWHDRAAVPGDRVWFDGRLLGRTDDSGRVDGTVPYVRELPLTAEAGDVDACHVAHLEMEMGIDEWRQVNGPVRIVVEDTDELETVEPTDGNVSTTLPVEGTAHLDVEGKPYPGETVRLNTTVHGVPMREATVTANGRQVGETDDGGHYDLTVPDDGTERLTVAVSRGDFTAEETIDVLLLSVDVRPSGLLAVPGHEATVVATVGDRRAENVSVAVAGESVGRTDAGGRVSIDLPADPRTTVHASGFGQTTTAPVWPIYLPLALLALVGFGVMVGSLAYAERRGSPRSTQAAVAFWAVVTVVVVAGIVEGRRGMALALAAVGVVAFVSATVFFRETVRQWLTSAARVVLAALWGLRRLAIRLADGLLWLGDRALALGQFLLARLSEMPRSVREILEVALAWLACIPGRVSKRARVVAAVLGRWLAEAGRTLRTPRGIVVLLASAGLVAGSCHVADLEGALAAAVAVLALLLVHRWRRTANVAVPSSTPGRNEGNSAPYGGSGGKSATSRVSLRTLWRTFARWIVPGRWRSSTPGEISRAAVDRGFPAEPVGRLTEVFREVEYGGRRLSEERWGRARSAFDALRTARSDEEGGDR